MPTKAAPQPHLPSRAGTVFISYARADDEKPPHDDTAQGWVTFLWDQLRWELTTRGAKQAKLWLDRYQIDPAESFTPKIEAAVKEAAVILPILSEEPGAEHLVPRRGRGFLARPGRRRAAGCPDLRPSSTARCCHRFSRTKRPRATTSSR